MGCAPHHRASRQQAAEVAFGRQLGEKSPPGGRLDIRLKYFNSLFSLFFIRKGVETLDEVNLFRIVRVEVFTI